MERGRKSNFTVDKSDKYSLSQVFNVYSVRDYTIYICNVTVMLIVCNLI